MFLLHERWPRMRKMMQDFINASGLKEPHVVAQQQELECLPLPPSASQRYEANLSRTAVCILFLNMLDSVIP